MDFDFGRFEFDLEINIDEMNHDRKAAIPKTRSPPTLPLEILDLIFSHLQRPQNHRHQQRDYAACSLVCWQWQRVGRRWVWRDPWMCGKDAALKFLGRHLEEMENLAKKTGNGRSGTGASASDYAHLPPSSFKQYMTMLELDLAQTPHRFVRHLDLSCVRFIEPDDTPFLHRIASATPHLLSLHLFCDPLDPRTLQHFLMSCTRLSHISLSGSVGGMQSRYFYQLPSVRAMDLQGLWRRLHTVRELDMGGMDCTRGDGITFATWVVGSVGPALKSFALGRVTGGTASGSSQILLEDALATLLAHHAPQLERFSGRGKLVTDRALESLVVLCPHLKIVDLENCSTITREGILALVEGGTALQEVHIGGTLANDAVVREAIERRVNHKIHRFKLEEPNRKIELLVNSSVPV
ncbi:hypothetical protein DFS34DRAFT_269453 [Phlyctochytrium arcticum]|nr:hypothetical protein DFS34DRAFT_269453 [Phlyctochytrium arcticum]